MLHALIIISQRSNLYVHLRGKHQLSEIPKRNYCLATASSPQSEDGCLVQHTDEHSSPSANDSPLSQPATICKPLPCAIMSMQPVMPPQALPAMPFLPVPMMALMAMQQQIALAAFMQRLQASANKFP
jgi:hypothetical protein